MAEFQYTTVPGKIKKLLSKIQGIGKPAKASSRWLKTIGFNSSNDVSLLVVLKFIKFIDGANVPTAKWND